MPYGSCRCALSGCRLPVTGYQATGNWERATARMSGGSRPEVVAARRAGLLDRDAMEHRDLRREAVPEPDGDHFRGGVGEAGDVVEAVVVELVDDRVDGLFQIGEIDQPAGGRIDLAAHGDLAAERVAVHAPALVALRHIRQPMGRFESKVLHQFHEM